MSYIKCIIILCLTIFSLILSPFQQVSYIKYMIINPRRMREGYGTAVCINFDRVLSAEPGNDSHAHYSRMANSKIGTHLTNTVV